MTARILTCGLFAGFLAGLLGAVLQFVFVQPLLLHAELYESGELIYDAAKGAPVVADVAGLELVRNALSALFMALTYVGFGLILMALMSMASDRGFAISARSGLMWGLCGFIAVQFAPAISLPAVVPGMASAEVAPRQIWWIATVAASGLGLALLAFSRSPVAWVIAAAVILAPHVIGAPRPQLFSGPLPPELASLFATRSLGVGAATWTVLGALAGYFWQREATQAHDGVAQRH